MIKGLGNILSAQSRTLREAFYNEAVHPNYLLTDQEKNDWFWFWYGLTI